jgi:hypothetical protein
VKHDRRLRNTRNVAPQREESTLSKVKTRELEQWPVEWFELLLPRHLEILREVDGRLEGEVRRRFPGDEGRFARARIVDVPASSLFYGSARRGLSRAT